MKSPIRGFTLIEILIVVAIVGILAAIAIPSYQESIRRGNRVDARNAMLNMAQMQERFYTNNTTYLAIAAAPAAPPAGWGTVNFSGSSLATRRFAISVAAGATGSIATSFIITATNDNGYSDPICPVMTLDNLGVKTPVPPAANCW